MKRIILLVIILCVALTCFVSCDKSNSEPFISVKMTKFNPWLESASASDLVMVEEVRYSYGIAPEREVICYHTTDSEVINDYLEYYSNIKLIPKLFAKLGMGGQSCEVIFTFADGSTKAITTDRGYYFGDIVGVFKISTSTPFDYKKMDTSFRFNSSSEKYTVYLPDDETTPLKEVDRGADQFRFMHYEGEVDENHSSTYIIKTSYAKITVYSDTLCYMDFTNEYSNLASGYYEIFGITFSEIIE